MLTPPVTNNITYFYLVCRIKSNLECVSAVKGSEAGHRKRGSEFCERPSAEAGAIAEPGT